MNVPYKIELKIGMPKDVEDGTYGLIRQLEMHGYYEIYIDKNENDSIGELKNTCIHELIHSYFMPSHELAIIGLGKEKAQMYMHTHERDVSTIASFLSAMIEVKEENMEESELLDLPKSFKKGKHPGVLK